MIGARLFFGVVGALFASTNGSKLVVDGLAITTLTPDNAEGLLRKKVEAAAKWECTLEWREGALKGNQAKALAISCHIKTDEGKSGYAVQFSSGAWNQFSWAGPPFQAKPVEEWSGQFGQPTKTEGEAVTWCLEDEKAFISAGVMDGKVTRLLIELVKDGCPKPAQESATPPAPAPETPAPEKPSDQQEAQP